MNGKARPPKVAKPRARREAPREWRPLDARRLIAWILKHVERESSFLYSNPAHYVPAMPLCDFIRKEAGGMTEEEFNTLADGLQRRKKT